MKQSVDTSLCTENNASAFSPATEYQTKSAAHIGFLDYTLFDDRPEFYASYKLINVKNHQKYSDSLTLHVVVTKWNGLKTRWCG